jgi:hypothetical protein
LGFVSLGASRLSVNAGIAGRRTSRLAWSGVWLLAVIVITT